MTDADLDRFTLVDDLLHTCVIGDVLDAIGRRHQYLPPGFVAVVPGSRLSGRAMPTITAPVDGPADRPFGRLTEALDRLRPGEIYVGEASSVSCAAWGEILTVTAMVRGARGAVIHGHHRDTRQLHALGWPVFSLGAHGEDSRVRAGVVDVGVPVTVGGVLITPGDLVVADADGVVVVPREVEDEVIDEAVAKVTAENHVLGAIRSGMSSTDAFARFGVL